MIHEIAENTNYKNSASVKEGIYNGDMEIYINKDEYVTAGYSLESTDSYLILSNGYVIHFYH
ncbi:hypothetical protein [Pseudobutyrivibrio sp.]